MTRDEFEDAKMKAFEFGYEQGMREAIRSLHAKLETLIDAPQIEQKMLELSGINTQEKIDE